MLGGRLGIDWGNAWTALSLGGVRAGHRLRGQRDVGRDGVGELRLGDTNADGFHQLGRAGRLPDDVWTWAGMV